MEGVKILCHQMKVRPLQTSPTDIACRPLQTSPVIELSQNTGLLLDKTLIHIPDSDTPTPPPPPPLPLPQAPAEANNVNQVLKDRKWCIKK